MVVRIALLLSLIVPLHAELARAQSTVIYEATGRGFRPDRVKFTPDGRYVLMVGDWTGDAAGDQPEFRAWDVHAGEFIGEHRFDEFAGINGLDVAPDGETLLVTVDRPARRTSYNGHKVWVWDEEVWLWGWEPRTVRPRSSRVRSVLTPIRRLTSVQGASPAPGARLWGRVLFSPDADLIAVHRNETRPLADWPQIRHFHEIDVLEPSGQLQATIVPPDPLRENTRGYTSGVAFSPDGRRLATTTLFDDTPPESGYVVRVDLRLWDVQSGEELAQRSVIDSAVTGRLSLAYHGVTLEFSPDGSLIASDGVDHTIQLWDADTLEPVRRLGEIRQDLMRSLAFSPDSRLLVAAADLRGNFGALRQDGFESQLLLWEVATGEVLLRIDEDLAEIDSVEFSLDGGWLLTRGGIAPDVAGWAVRLWDVNHLLAIGADAEQADE